MAKEIKVSVFVNKHYYQESSSRRTYGDMLDNRYSILLDKSTTITFSSPITVNKEKLPCLFENLLLTTDYQASTSSFKEGNDNYLAELDGYITSSYDEALTIIAVGILNSLNIYNTLFVVSDKRELFNLKSNEKPMTSFMGSSPMKYVRNVQDIKEYGLNHPDEYSSELYVFAADFVHFNRGVSRVWKLIVYIPEMDRYIDIDGNHIAGQPINGFVLEGHEWVSKLPIYEDLSL